MKKIFPEFIILQTRQLTPTREREMQLATQYGKRFSGLCRAARNPTSNITSINHFDVYNLKPESYLLGQAITIQLIIEMQIEK